MVGGREGGISLCNALDLQCLCCSVNRLLSRAVYIRASSYGGTCMVKADTVT